MNMQTAIGRRPERFRRLVALCERDEIEAAVDALLAYFDHWQGDVDLELNGDELDGTGSAEDDTPLHAFGRGDRYPGDPEDAEHDDEWEPTHV